MLLTFCLLLLSCPFLCFLCVCFFAFWCSFVFKPEIQPNFTYLIFQYKLSGNFCWKSLFSLMCSSIASVRACIPNYCNFWNFWTARLAHLGQTKLISAGLKIIRNCLWKTAPTYSSAFASLGRPVWQGRILMRTITLCGLTCAERAGILSPKACVRSLDPLEVELPESMNENSAGLLVNYWCFKIIKLEWIRMFFFFVTT